MHIVAPLRRDRRSSKSKAYDSLPRHMSVGPCFVIVVLWIVRCVRAGDTPSRRDRWKVACCEPSAIFGSSLSLSLSLSRPVVAGIRRRHVAPSDGEAPSGRSALYLAVVALRVSVYLQPLLRLAWGVLWRALFPSLAGAGALLSICIPKAQDVACSMLRVLHCFLCYLAVVFEWDACEWFRCLVEGRRLEEPFDEHDVIPEEVTLRHRLYLVKAPPPRGGEWDEYFVLQAADTADRWVCFSSGSEYGFYDVVSRRLLPPRPWHRRESHRFWAGWNACRSVN